MELHSPGDCASVGVLHPLKFHVQHKQPPTSNELAAIQIKESAEARLGTDVQLDECRNPQACESTDQVYNELRGKVVYVPDGYTANVESRGTDGGSYHEAIGKQDSIHFYRGGNFFVASAAIELSEKVKGQPKFAEDSFSRALSNVQRGRLFVASVSLTKDADCDSTLEVNVAVVVSIIIAKMLSAHIQCPCHSLSELVRLRGILGRAQVHARQIIARQYF